MPDYAYNGWTFKLEKETDRRADGTAPAVAWVYRDVKHAGHNFAREISIEKIIVEIDADGKPETRSLKYSEFTAQRWEETFELVPVRSMEGAYVFSFANFSVYQGTGPILKLKTKKGVLPSQIEHGKQIDEPLYLFVVFGFSAYGNDPPHEFTGALAAARFTPAIRFETKNRSVKSVRVHYRFHLDLDSCLQTALPLTRWWEEMKNEIRGRENYALVLRDGDYFPPSALEVIRLFKDVFALKEGVEFFNARIDECGYEGTCQSECAKLELELAHVAGDPDTITPDRLDITFRRPGVTTADASAPLAKTTVSVQDEAIAALLGADPDAYDAAEVDTLVEKISNAVAGTEPVQGSIEFPGFVPVLFAGSPMPGISDKCLARCIKHRLLRMAGWSYVLRKGAAILARLGPLGKTIKSDLANVMEDVELSDQEKVLANITVLIPALLLEPPPIFLLSPVTLGLLVKLALDLQELAGKVISIVSFPGAEKPVLYEIVGRYVINGNVTHTWDDMHWWGTEKIPSAPGAFFAAHSHFRWTRLNTYPTPEEAELLNQLNALVKGSRLHLGAPQLRSLVKKFAENQLSGPLIDPGIPKQTVLFAIARNGGELDGKLKQSNKPFDHADLTPKLIAKVSDQGNRGADIVYWLSCQARRTGEEVFKGNLFINGFYFAHDEEKPFSLFRPSNMFAPTEGVDLQKPKRTEPYQDLVRDPF